VVALSWEEIGREYMMRAKRADIWKGILYGIAHTNLSNVDRDRETVERLLELAPSPEAARRACPIDPAFVADLPFYKAETATTALCDKAENAENIIPALRSCARDKLQGMKREQIKTKEKSLDLVGLKWKGIDMTLLDCGCEVPVIDRHIARYLMRVDPRFFKEMGEPTEENFEERLREVQNSANPGRYERLWRIAREHAERSGLPAGVWHVAVWMRERFAKRYPKVSEEKRLEVARDYVRQLF
jgi:hypothetical protein